MKKIKFDSLFLLLGGIFFGVYLALYEKEFLKFPNVFLTVYFFICLICFSLVGEYYTNKFSQNSFVLRLVYVGLYVFSPLLIVFIIFGGKKYEDNK
ncbi:hypothetical protein [Streptococcus marmotae]|uniref:hypothetical protein n=1 Tax=Streptococcus marmotae TaxID=1825069 RepID=UPI0008372FE3|nr:hypothetical protein [Streptococcus marmotae]